MTQKQWYFLPSEHGTGMRASRVEFRWVHFGPYDGVRWEITGLAKGPGKPNVEEEGGCEYDIQCRCKVCRLCDAPSTAKNVPQALLAEAISATCKCAGPKCEVFDDDV